MRLPPHRFAALAVLLAGAALSGAIPALASQGITVPDSPTASVSGRTVSIDGQPIFLIAAWATCAADVPQELALGVNTFVGSLCDEQSLAQAAAGKAFLINQESYDSDAGMWEVPTPVPGEIGSLQPDEPDRQQIPAGQLVAPPGGGQLTLLNLTMNFWNGAGASLNYQPYFQKGDILTTDVYPVEGNCESPAYVNVGTVYDVQQQLASLGKPNFQWLEDNNVDGGCGNRLTASIVEAEAWESVEGGAVGIGWFFPQSNGSGTYDSFDVPDSSIQAAVKTVDTEMTTMAPILLAPTFAASTPWGNGQASGQGSNPIKIGGRIFGGQNYLLATNSAAGSVVWQRQLPSMVRGETVKLESPSGQVLEQLVTNKNGILPPISFAPYDTDILVWTPELTPPAKPKTTIKAKAKSKAKPKSAGATKTATR